MISKSTVVFPSSGYTNETSRKTLTTITGHVGTDGKKKNNVLHKLSDEEELELKDDALKLQDKYGEAAGAMLLLAAEPVVFVDEDDEDPGKALAAEALRGIKSGGGGGDEDDQEKSDAAEAMLLLAGEPVVLVDEGNKAPGKALVAEALRRIKSGGDGNEDDEHQSKKPFTLLQFEAKLAYLAVVLLLDLKNDIRGRIYNYEHVLLELKAAQGLICLSEE